MDTSSKYTYTHNTSTSKYSTYISSNIETFQVSTEYRQYTEPVDVN
jgi:hypothetical protein